MSSKKVRRLAALEQLRDDPEVIVIHRVPSGPGWPAYWVISTAGHNSHHWHRELDADLMIRVLMENQERDTP